jgi:glycosyltransferase involved in cell wall biosynthesis
MKITFYSNFLTHHQLPFCLEMYKKYGEDFKFVSMEKINQERISLGYKDMDNDYPFVLKAYESKEKYNEATKLAVDSDIVIAGSTPTDDYIKERLKQDKITFRYYARIFYNGVLSIFDFENSKKVYDRHLKYKKNKNLYLLCASSYGPNDFNELGMYKNKCFKWGYFPETKIYNVEDLLKQKENEKIEIIWVGRFIKEKHPEYVVKLAQKLKEKNYNFEIKMIGNGELLEKTKSQIEKYNLTNQIKLVGAVKSDKVRLYMEKANIFICTSDKNERWGVVLNEAMNSGCAVIAYKGIGGVPFLIKNNENGLAYTSLDDFYKKTMKVMDDKALREKLSKNAYKTISEVWTAKVAVQNFEKLVKSIINGKPNPVKEGPASTAYPVN